MLGHRQRGGQSRGGRGDLPFRFGLGRKEKGGFGAGGGWCNLEQVGGSMPAKIPSRATLDLPQNSANPCRTGAVMGQDQGFRKISDEELEEILKLNPADWPAYQAVNSEELKNILEQHRRWRDSLGGEGEQANLRWTSLRDKDLENVRLDGALLEGTNFSNSNLSSAHLYRAKLSFAELFRANLSFAILNDADLSYAWLPNANLSSARLQNANLSSANLYGANFSSSNLYSANLRGSDLTGADFQGAELAGTVLAEARLSYSEFRDLPRRSISEKNGSQKPLQKIRGKNSEGSEQPSLETTYRDDSTEVLLPAINLHSRQLAGADLSNAGVPVQVWQGFEDGLSNVAEATKKVDKLFVGLLAGCAYFALVLALLTPGASVKLPIINTLIPQDVFFWAAPLGVLLVYLYFQLNLQRLWERLAELPAVFEDGTPLDKKASPWLIVGYVRAHFRLLRDEDRPPLSWMQTLVIQLLVWWCAPASLFAMWLRHLHDSPSPAVCAVQLALTTAIVGAALVFLCLARRTLRLENLDWPMLQDWWPPEYGVPKKREKEKEMLIKKTTSFFIKHWWRILIVAVVGAAMAWYSWHVISNAPLC